MEGSSYPMTKERRERIERGGYRLKLSDEIVCKMEEEFHRRIILRKVNELDKCDGKNSFELILNSIDIEKCSFKVKSELYPNVKEMTREEILQNYALMDLIHYLFEERRKIVCVNYNLEKFKI